MSKRTRKIPFRQTLKKASGNATPANTSAKREPRNPPPRPARNPARRPAKRAGLRARKSRASLASKTLKSSVPRAAAARKAAGSEGRGDDARYPIPEREAPAPPSACPAMAATISRSTISPVAGCCRLSIREPTPRAAPARLFIHTRLRNVFRRKPNRRTGKSLADLPKAQEAFRDKDHLTMPLASYVSSCMCSRPTAPGSPNPCMEGPSRAFFAPWY